MALNESLSPKSYRLSSEDVANIEDLAKRMNMKPSQIVRMMIVLIYDLSAIDSFKDFFYHLSRMDTFNLARKDLPLIQDNGNVNDVIQSGKEVIRNPEKGEDVNSVIQTPEIVIRGSSK